MHHTQPMFVHMFCIQALTLQQCTHNFSSLSVVWQVKNIEVVVLSVCVCVGGGGGVTPSPADTHITPLGVGFSAHKLNVELKTVRFWVWDS